RTSLRLSFRVTSAARSSRLSLLESAIADNVPIEHGTTIIASIGNDPLEIAAATSPCLYFTSARLSTAAGSQSVSRLIVCRPAGLMTRWVSTFEFARRSSRSRIAYTTPLAPEMPTIRRKRSVSGLDRLCRGTGTYEVEARLDHVFAGAGLRRVRVPGFQCLLDVPVLLDDLLVTHRVRISCRAQQADEVDHAPAQRSKPLVGAGPKDRVVEAHIRLDHSRPISTLMRRF